MLQSAVHNLARPLNNLASRRAIMAPPHQACGTYVILVGIDDYTPCFPPCANLHDGLYNVHLMETLLCTRPPTKKYVLTSPLDPTIQCAMVKLPEKQNVKDVCAEVAKQAGKNDMIWFYYSGHGKEERNAATSPSFGEKTEALVLLDDELWDYEMTDLLHALTCTGARVTVLLDCFHSGGATRKAPDFHQHAADFKIKSVDPSSRLIPPKASTAGRSRVTRVQPHWLTDTKDVEFIAACHDHEKAKEFVFTKCLCAALDLNKTRASNMTLEMTLNAALQEKGGMPAGANQEFVMGGGKHRLFFAINKIPQHRIRVARVVPHQIQVEFDAGWVHGLRVGQELGIYGPNTTFDSILDYLEPVATCTLEIVEDWTSRCASVHTIYGSRVDLATMPNPPKQYYTAVPIRHILKQALAMPIKTTVRADNQALTSKAADVESDLRSNFSLITLDSSGHFLVQIVSNSTAEISFTPSPVTGPSAKPVCILVQLSELRVYHPHLALYSNISQLGRVSVTTLSNKLGVTIEGTINEHNYANDINISDGDTRLVPIKKQDPIEVSNGDILMLRVQNLNSMTLFLEILCIEPSGQISRISPTGDNTPIELTPANSKPLFIPIHKSPPARNFKGEDFDTIAIFGTNSTSPHFPENILLELMKSQAEVDLENLVKPSAGATRTSNPSLIWAGVSVNVRIV